MDIGNTCNLLFYTWAGKYHLSIPIISILIIIVIIVLLVIFRNHQPLKSRGPIPYLSIPYMVAYQIYAFIDNEIIPLETRTSYSCWNKFYLHPTAEMFYLLIVLHVLRYIIIINMNAIKAVHLKTGNEKNRVFRILKIITSPLTMICVIIGWLLLWITYYFIAFAIGGFDCKKVFPIITGPWIGIVTTSLYAVLLIGGILFDLISNYKLKCNPIAYFYRKDPFLFRFEILFFLLCALLLLISIVVGFKDPVNVIYDSILLIAFSFTITVFPLCVTITKFVKNKKISNQNKGMTIEQFMKDDEIKALFIEFSQNEWSLENIMLWVI